MIDYEAIGNRIREERKLGKGVSQEAMAADLGLYQSDISNLERGKKGSGIADLNRLERIARYFAVPLQQLLFGKAETGIPRYKRGRWEFRRLAEAAERSDANARKVAGFFKGVRPSIEIAELACGPYRILAAFDCLSLQSEDGALQGVPLDQLHFFVFLEGRIIATMKAGAVTLFMAMNQTAAGCLQRLIPQDVFDFADVALRVNPFALLQQAEKDEEKRQAAEGAFFERLEQLRGFSDELLLIVQSLYVRESCRRRGLCALLIDALQALFGKDLSIWLNLQPADEEDAGAGGASFPACTPSRLGQMSLNASIAERLGFRLETDLWSLPVQVTDGSGRAVLEQRKVQKIAYRPSPRLARVIADDGDLVDYGRSLLNVEAGRGGIPGAAGSSSSN